MEKITDRLAAVAAKFAAANAQQQERFLSALRAAESWLTCDLSRLTAAPKKETRKAPPPCAHRGELLRRGSCTCGDGDVYECKREEINGKPVQVTVRTCRKCKFAG